MHLKRIFSVDDYAPYLFCDGPFTHSHHRRRMVQGEIPLRVAAVHLAAC